MSEKILFVKIWCHICQDAKQKIIWHEMPGFDFGFLQQIKQVLTNSDLTIVLGWF
jgi:hypothetical protein